MNSPSFEGLHAPIFLCHQGPHPSLLAGLTINEESQRAKSNVETGGFHPMDELHFLDYFFLVVVALSANQKGGPFIALIG